MAATKPSKMTPAGNKSMRRSLLAGGKKLYTSLLGRDRYLRLKAAARIKKVGQHNRELLLVHTMGKVGSTSVVASLMALGHEKSMSMYQPHFLSREWLSYANRMEAGGSKGWAKLALLNRKGFPKEQGLLREIERRRSERLRVRVITLVRDPVAINISGLFHNHEWWSEEFGLPVTEPAADYLQKLTGWFLDHYPHEVPAQWFDKEFEPLYGLDVFNTPFDMDQGYAIYRNDFADVLLLKLESLDRSVAGAFREFLGIDDFRLVTTNTAENKEYAHVYRSFRMQLALPDDYLDQVYDSRMARHFYTPEEIAVFRRKWAGK